MHSLSLLLERCRAKKPPFFGVFSTAFEPVFFCAHAPTTPRTSSQAIGHPDEEWERLKQDHLQQLAEIARSPEVARIFDLMLADDNEARSARDDYPTHEKLI